MNMVSKEMIAEMCHEANRLWCMLNGDMTQPSWADAPQWQKDSAMQGVEFHWENPDAGDAASHNSWMKQKIEAGWVYGPVKDPEANPPTHPCIVPFSELPLVQQKKDAIFRSLVHALSDM